MQPAETVTVRPGGSLTIRYDGPLTAEQAGTMRARLAQALPGVEVTVVIVGQGVPDVTARRAIRILTGGGMHPDLAADMVTAIAQAGGDPAAFAEYFTQVRRELMREMPDGGKP